MAISHREKKWCDQAYCVLTFCIVKALQGAMDRMSLKSRRYVPIRPGREGITQDVSVTVNPKPNPVGR